MERIWEASVSTVAREARLCFGEARKAFRRSSSSDAGG